MVGTMPMISTSGLRFSRTIASVFSSCTSPRSEGDAEVERGRRLRDAALLVGERDHVCLGSRRRVRRANVRARKEARETHRSAVLAEPTHSFYGFAMRTGTRIRGHVTWDSVDRR